MASAPSAAMHACTQQFLAAIAQLKLASMLWIEVKDAKIFGCVAPMARFLRSIFFCPSLSILWVSPWLAAAKRLSWMARVTGLPALHQALKLPFQISLPQAAFLAPFGAPLDGLTPFGLPLLCADPVGSGSFTRHCLQDQNIQDGYVLGSVSKFSFALRAGLPRNSSALNRLVALFLLAAPSAFARRVLRCLRLTLQPEELVETATQTSSIVLLYCLLAFSSWRKGVGVLTYVSTWFSLCHFMPRIARSKKEVVPTYVHNVLMQGG